MGAGPNAGSFFSAFGEALGANLLSYEKEKRAKKHEQDLTAVSVWTDLLKDPRQPYGRRRVAAQQLRRLTGVKELEQLVDLFPQELAQEEGPAEQPGSPGLVPALPERPEVLVHELGHPGPQVFGQAASQLGQQQTLFPPLTPRLDQSPLYPSVTKGQPAQAPTNLRTAAPRLLRVPQSDFEREQLLQLEHQRELETFRTDENIRQAEAELDFRRKAQAGELGQMVPGFVDAGNGEAGVVYVNQLNGERTIVKIGRPFNELKQKMQQLEQAGIQLNPQDFKKVVLGISPSAAEAEALQSTKDWIDAKNPNPAISGPARLRIEEQQASVSASRALTAERAAGLLKPSEKQIQGQALKDAIFVFSGTYRRDFLLRRQQAHLARLRELGEEAMAGSDPELAKALQASRLTGNRDQAMARVAMQLAQKDAQDYYSRLVALMRQGEGPKVVHLQAIRREAEMARKERLDQNLVWNWYKQAQAQGQLMIVDDELQPWLGDPETESRPPLGPVPRRFIPKN